MPNPPLSDLVVIFDLDGTLVDSAPDLTEAMNAILTREGLSPLPAGEVRHLVGEGARALLERGFAENGRAFPQGSAGDRLVSDYIDHYEDHIADSSFVFEGCDACLEALARAGATLAVCTNKVERLAFPLLRALGLLSRFEIVLGRDSLAAHKPDPAPLQEILRRSGRSRGVMVGDTLTDLLAGRRAGMPVLLAEFGYGTEDIPLETSEQRFADYEALFEMIIRIGNGVAMSERGTI